MGRQAPRPHQTYAQANPGRIGVEVDVLGYRDKIEKTWPQLEVVFDMVDECWVIIEHCLDGQERLLFDTDHLGEDTIERIRRADQAGQQQEDLNKKLEREQDETFAREERAFGDKVEEIGERLIHAFKKDGFYNHTDIYGPRRKAIHGNVIQRTRDADQC